jgi:hypothetical protein
VCEFYDPFSFELIRQFEAFGFCKEGEGGDFVMDGRIEIGGEFPLVTNGGLLSFSHPGTAQLLQKVTSSALQLRGAYPKELTVPGRDGRDDQQRRRGRAVLRRDAAREGARMSARASRCRARPSCRSRTGTAAATAHCASSAAATAARPCSSRSPCARAASAARSSG